MLAPPVVCSRVVPLGGVVLPPLDELPVKASTRPTTRPATSTAAEMATTQKVLDGTMNAHSDCGPDSLPHLTRSIWNPINS